MSNQTLPLDQILHGDCIEVLKELPDQCIDLVFADPPYNLQLRKDLWRPNMTKVNGVEDEWDQFESFQAYDDFTRAWLTECRRVLKDTGTLWVIGSYHNIFRVGAILMDLGYWILNETVWIKTNPMPHFRGVRFTNAHETLIWAKKSEKSRYTFNYQLMKRMNGGKQMRSDWVIPICSGPERIKINGEKAHSTQKPMALLERVVLSSSNPGDVVLDPFFGTGTTGAVAKHHGRYWIGIERDPLYIKVAQKRINLVQPPLMAEMPEQPDAPQPRIPFARLLDQGLLVEGQRVYFRAELSNAAEVVAGGRLRYGTFEGSIHQVGRHMQGSPCNGWEHWFYADESGELLPIDRLRDMVRAKPQESENENIP
ncbi:MAG: site-specific DNA-methyltransferase [Anaerolineae bacterium]